MKDKYRSILIIVIGLFLWFLYLCDSEMSRYGIYTIFSYGTHELLSGVPFLCIIVSVGWIVVTLVRIIGKKELKSNLILGLLLLVLCTAQFIYLHNLLQTYTTSFSASIKSIDKQKQEIIIEKEGNSLILECPMLAQELIKADGTQYLITYEWNKSKPDYGKVCLIQASN